jgi:hypothetical protein
VRIEAGLTGPGATDAAFSASDLEVDAFGALTAGDEMRLERRIVLDVIIDVASQRARVAFMRDVTHADLTRFLRSRLGADADGNPDGDPGGDPGGDRVARPAGAGGPRHDEAPDRRPDHLVDLDFGGAPEPGAPAAAPDEAPRPSAEPAPALEDEPVFIDRRRGRWTTGGGS